MLSPAETDRITKDLATLNEAFEGVTDSGIRKVIQEWTLDAEMALAEGAKKRT
jgi:hypothetical protein